MTMMRILTASEISARIAELEDTLTERRRQHAEAKRHLEAQIAKLHSQLNSTSPVRAYTRSGSADRHLCHLQMSASENPFT